MHPEPNRDPNQPPRRSIPMGPRKAGPKEPAPNPNKPARPFKVVESDSERSGQELPAPTVLRPKVEPTPAPGPSSPPDLQRTQRPQQAPRPEAQGPEPKQPEPQAALPSAPKQSGPPLPPKSSGPADPLGVDSLSKVLTSTTSSPRHKVEAWLAVMTKQGASDLILRAGGRPSLRVNGKITFLPGRVPGAGALLEVLEAVMGEKRMDTWRATGSADAGLHLDGLGRFRLNAYKQIGEPAVVIRRINEEAPSLNGLNLPSEQLKRLAMRKRGLILVTGIAGSGKSTTLSAMIEYMNQTTERHIVTLEDPVELLFTEERCVISQREVGTDCESFQDGLRHALRQSPDAILIGEMRDAETVSAALDATETGHLVLSTLHTVNSPQTVERILSFFPAEQHKQLRSRMADNVAGILSQRLVPSCDGQSLVPAFELLLTTPHIRELLALGDTAEIARVIDSGSEKGIVSFNQCLRQLVLRQQINLDDALAASDRPEELVLALRGITGSNAKIDPTIVRKEPEEGNDGLRMARHGE